MDVDRVSLGLADEVPLVVLVGCISPLAAVSLFVKDEIAHPAQDVSFWVPIRVEPELVESIAFGGGRAVSARVVPNFRTRWR